VAYAAAPPTGAVVNWINCSYINDLKKPSVKLGKDMTGFLDHSGTGNFSTLNIRNCYGRNIGVAFAVNATESNILDSYFEKVTGQMFNLGSIVANIKNTFIQGLKDTDYSTVPNTVNFSNSVVIKLRWSGSPIGIINHNNTLIFNEFANSASPDAPNYMTDSTNPTMITAYNSVFFGYDCSIVSTTGKYLGDYNVFAWKATAINFKNRFNGINYESLSSWQTATGQDANSVYLTPAQKETFFLTDPNSGDIIVNPFCKVTAANGTVYTGTFPDGTRISDKFTNKMFAKNRKD